MIRSLFITLFLLIGLSLEAQTGELKLNITGLRNSKGKCNIYIYNNKEGFPTKPEKAFRSLSGEISQNTCNVIVRGLSSGDYAIAVVHDENGNDKIDTNFLGIPREGLGSSNNPKSFGPPSFSDAKFTVTGKEQSMEIVIKYI